MNRQAVIAYAEAWGNEEKIEILRGVTAIYDYETLEAICTYIMEGNIPQVVPQAKKIKQVGKPRGMHARKVKAG